MTSFNVEKHIDIKASKEKVWDALTNPMVIKKYLFGTEAISEWKVGSTLIFRGEFDRQEYADKGIIQRLDIGELFQYTYLSSFSGLEDKDENYHLITYTLELMHKGVSLQLKHENIQNEKARDHAYNNWDFVLKEIKEIVEK